MIKICFGLLFFCFVIMSPRLGLYSLKNENFYKRGRQNEKL